MFTENLKTVLKKHEADRLDLYKCSAGKWTIGTGHNIQDNGIPQEVSDLLLDIDVKDVLKKCRENFKWFCGLSETRRIVVASMVFNLGLVGFKKFRKTIICIGLKEYKGAALEMLDSRWAEQVGRRAVELADMMVEG
jgi:lysozyme